MPGESKKKPTLVVVEPENLPARYERFPPPLDLPVEVHELWRSAVSEIEGHGLQEFDLEAVRMMVLAAYRHRQASQYLTDFGLLVQDAKGRPIVNPMLKVERDQAMLFAHFAREFGGTIRARLQLGLIHLAGRSLMQSLNDSLDA